MAVLPRLFDAFKYKPGLIFIRTQIPKNFTNKIIFYF